MSEQKSLCSLFSTCSWMQWNSYKSLGLEDKDETSDSLISSSSTVSTLPRKLSMEETTIHMEENGIQNPTGEQGWALQVTEE